jgi:Tfp pilus assembly protein PilF
LRARASLSEILGKKPDSKRGPALMANILEQQGDTEALRKVYEKILSLDPKMKPWVTIWGFWNTKQGISETRIALF